MGTWLSERQQDLVMKFLNPLETPLPTEIHELSRLLLDDYRYQASKAGGSISFYRFLIEIFKTYYPYIENLILKKRVTVQENTNILKWWKEILAVPSSQGLLLATPYSPAAPLLKLCIVTGYVVSTKWNKRSLRKLMNNFEQEMESNHSLHEFSSRIPADELRMLETHVSSAEDEVDELAETLSDARKRIYWKVTKLSSDFAQGLKFKKVSRK